jgi:autotransporter-associated beta strand protein
MQPKSLITDGNRLKPMKTAKDGRLAARGLAALLTVLYCCAFPAHAQISTWRLNPAAGDSFNTTTNWIPVGVPTGTALFGPTNGNVPLILANTRLNLILFGANAPSYSLGVFGPNTLELIGGGISNLSANHQVVDVLSGGTLAFGGSSAGNETIGYSNRGGTILFNASTAGSANFENQSGGTITFVNSSAGSSVINNNFGAATINFQGLSSADNSTISNFTLQGGGRIVFSGFSTAASAVITNFTAADSITFSGLSNAGNSTLQNVFGSTIIFTGASSGADAHVTSNGIFDISELTTGGTTVGSIAGSGEFFLGDKVLVTGLDGRSTTVTGIIADSGMGGGSGGQLDKVGPGTLTLLGNNTYSGGTNFIGGVVAVENDNNLGTGPLTFNGGTLEALSSGGGIDSDKPVELNTRGGTFLADAGTTSTLNGLLSGPGSFTKDGPGSLILTFDNSYTGGTTIKGGVLQLGNGGTTGDIQGNVQDNGTLVFNHSGTANGAKRTFDGLIYGTGSVVKAGRDTLELTNDNTFTGRLTIQNGILVAGIPAGSNQTTSYALGQGDVYLQAGTLRAPTLDPITINVGRDYIQGPNGTLELGVQGIDGKDYDHIVAAGSASVGGTLSVFSLNNFAPSNGNAFEVVRGDAGRSGTFSTINDFLNLNHLQRVDIYAKNAVVLLYLAPQPIEPPEPPIKPPVIPPVPGEMPGPNPPPIEEQDPDEVVPPTEPDAPIPEQEVVRLVDPTAGELTSLYQIGFSAADMQRFSLGDRMFQIQQSVVPPQPVTELASPTTKENEGKALEGKAPPPAPPPSPINRWGVWASSWGDFVDLDSTIAAQGYRFTTFGISAGVDYLIIPNHFAVGLLGGYSHSWINLTPSGSATANTGRGGLYATYFNQGWWVDVAGWAGGTNYSTSRQALAGTANGETSGWEASTFGEAGKDFLCGNFSFGPTVAMQYTNVHLNGFGENGSLVPLDIHGDSQDSLVTDVGGRAYYTWHGSNTTVIPQVKLAWEHEFLYSTLPLTISAPALAGATTTVNGPSVGHDSMIIDATLSIQPTSRIWLTIGYDGQVLRDHYFSNSVIGTLSFTF